MIVRTAPLVAWAAWAALAASVALSVLAGCDAKKEPPVTAKLGEPIGIRVDDVKDASGKKLGNLSGAFAVTKGQEAETLVPEMARVLNQVGKACPALFAKGADPIHAVGKTSKGVLDFGPAASGETVEQKCFREAMNGQRISERALDTEIGVELRPEVASP